MNASVLYADNVNNDVSGESVSLETTEQSTMNDVSVESASLETTEPIAMKGPDSNICLSIPNYITTNKAITTKVAEYKKQH